jgi:hypothetical protein
VEVADAEYERTARRARRFLWAFRLIFYPGAALVAFLLLTGSGNGDGEDLTALNGRTARGAEFLLWTHDGEPRQFHTKITAVCPDGSEYTLDWLRMDSDRISFDKRSGTVDAAWMWRGTWSNGVPADAYARLRGRLDGGAVRGTLRLIDHRAGYDCDSAAVSFSARAD